MDGVTAAIAKALYPKHGVTQADFTAYEVGKDAFRSSSATRPSPRPWSRRTRPIARSAWCCTITSSPSRSMPSSRAARCVRHVDRHDEQARHHGREYIAERAWLAGAIRLPGGPSPRTPGPRSRPTSSSWSRRCRAKSARHGRRRIRGSRPSTSKLPNKEGGKTEGHVSRYFHDNPEMVLGEQGFRPALSRAVRRQQRRPRPRQGAGRSVDRLPEGAMRSELRQGARCHRRLRRRRGEERLLLPEGRRALPEAGRHRPRGRDQGQGQQDRAQRAGAGRSSATSSPSATSCAPSTPGTSRPLRPRIQRSPRAAPRPNARH
jgi:hypothetical protein